MLVLDHVGAAGREGWSFHFAKLVEIGQLTPGAVNKEAQCLLEQFRPGWWRGTYERNVYVAELAKRRANGICQLCDHPAPFANKSGDPFLESHHIVWLSQKGEDTVENTVALCPNCHKKMHVLNLKPDRKKLIQEAQKVCCQLTLTGEAIYV